MTGKSQRSLHTTNRLDCPLRRWRVKRAITMAPDEQRRSAVSIMAGHHQLSADERADLGGQRTLFYSADPKWKKARIRCSNWP